MAHIEKKFRIQAFDTDFNMIQDRLLGQDSEFSQGPKESHKGPLKIEVCLFEQEDIDRFTQYLERLRKDIPIKEKGARRLRRKVKVEGPTPNEALIDTLHIILEAGELNQFLKDEGFVYTNPQLIGDLKLPIAYPKGVDLEDYRLLVKLVKKSKNPLNNKYDCSLIILTERTGDGLIVCHLGETVIQKTIMDLSKNTIKVPKSMNTVFPEYMTLEERNKFRIEKAKLEEDPDKQPSAFYRRWVHFVDAQNKGRGIVFPRIDQITKPY